MADKKISELDLALLINDDAEFPFSQDNAGEPTTFKGRITQLGTKIAEDMTFSNLQTTSKKLVGAINELLSLGSPIIIGTTAPTSSIGSDGNIYVQYTEGTGGADDEVDGIYVKIDGAWCEISTGGGSGTTDYEDLSNKPQVNSIELVGNKSLDDLGIMPASLSKTASGSIAHFTDGADNIPVKLLKSAIVAVQDLHGYDHPWVGGAGKNKFDQSQLLEANGWAINSDGFYFGSISALYAKYGTGFSIEYDFLPNTSYIFSAQTGSNSTGIARIVVNYTDGTSENRTFESQTILATVANKTVRNFSFTYNTNGTLYVKDMMIRLATETDATFAPYENICPISGFDSGDITRCSVNLIKKQALMQPVHLASGTTIYTKLFNFSGQFNLYGLKKGLPDISTNWTVLLSMGSSLRSVTLTDDYEYIGISSGAYSDLGSGDMQVSLAPFSDFSAYNGNTYTFAFGQTVFGGHFNNKGNLVVTHGFIDLGTLSGWTYNSTQNFWQHAIPDIASNTDNVLCEGYNYSNRSWGSLVNYEFGISGTNMRLHNDTVSTSAELETQLNGIHLKYLLANPITLSITSQDIPTLLGENNIFSNCGDVEVDYYTDNANEIVEVAKATASTPLHNYSTDEQIVGTWIDGSTIYEKTFDLGSDVVVKYDTWTDMDISATSYDKFISCSFINASGTFYPLMVSVQNANIYCLACRSGSNVGGRYLTIQYTKSST